MNSKENQFSINSCSHFIYIIFSLFVFKLTDEEIDKYLEKHKQMKHKFDVYIQLKQLIAPLVEYIILLDRLIFLFEHELDSIERAQNSNELSQSPKRQESYAENCSYEHFIVKLFDPAKSPRCYALVSYLT
jgi:hypothetical protein